MIATLEITNRNGYKVNVEFVLIENMLLDNQVNRIAKNFSNVDVAVLTFEEHARTQTHMFQFDGGVTV